MNSGVTLYASGVVPNIKEGIEQSYELLSSGAAMKKLDELIEFSHKVKEEA